MGWFDTVKSPKLKNIKRPQSSTPAGHWKKCTGCAEIIQTSKLDLNFEVCPYCDFHYRLSAEKRIELLVDPGSFKVYDQDLCSSDPLVFKDKKEYKIRLAESKDLLSESDATIIGTGDIHGQKVSLVVMNFRFMGGSMGVVTGEKVARAMDLAYKKKIPCIVVSCSGGARMQEGLLSLMQMAKTAGARGRLKRAGIPYFSVLTDPTTGGVAASYAMLGDLNIAEPKALIGFAGPRVIEQTIREKLPEGFQRSEFLLEHGFIDAIVHRNELKDYLGFYVKMFRPLHVQQAVR